MVNPACPKTLEKTKAASLGIQRNIGRAGLVLKKTGSTNNIFLYITISTVLLMRVFCTKHKI